ncbi:hypothetical protein KP509_14G073000 [Ceratopteris richardii]|uniref:Septum formation inhibitor MinC C-terminal domain-containing protein n=1 Tax=Ceratopteris richardii TaxID=49495 RepID=A0A8T2TD15_CERRI|nr:hypothetical protein KP509_14G073000 [Ceratopteris richardii]KAH7416055.1 hypothetical protein KP509_14G073000 [Ceratopteris richardii]
MVGSAHIMASRIVCSVQGYVHGPECFCRRAAPVNARMSTCSPPSLSIRATFASHYAKPISASLGEGSKLHRCYWFRSSMHGFDGFLGRASSAATGVSTCTAPRMGRSAAIASRLAIRAQAHGAASESNSMSFSLSKTSSLPSIVISRNILPGESVVFDGVVVVKGDVSSGAAVHASNDIIVFGKLEGEAHAGKNGDSNAMISAWNLRCTSLSIAGHHAEASLLDKDHIYQSAYLSGCEVRVLDASARDLKCSSSNDADCRNDRASNSGFISLLAKDWRSMRKPSKIAVFTGAYISIVGVALLLFPVSLFGLFFDPTRSVKEWIRVAAVLAVVFGVYYIGTAWGDAKGYNGATSFYVSTIVGRVFIFLSFWWLAATCVGGLPLFASDTKFGAVAGERASRTSV